MNDKFDMPKLKSVVTSLIDLPNILNSQSKKERAYGRDRLNNWIIPTIEMLVEQGRDSFSAYSSDEIKDRFGEYKLLIKEGKYDGASKHARGWLRSLREYIIYYQL